MANPSYSLDPSGSGPYTTLPGYYRFGGEPRSDDEEDIDLTTDSGRKFVYNLFTRKVFVLNWKLKPADVDAFENLHDAVSGKVFPFYFSLSGTGGEDAVYVRKEAGFRPIESDSPGDKDSIFDYQMTLIEELP